MSHSITQTKTIFSGKMALLSSFIIGAMFTGQVFANDFTPSEQASIDQHLEILADQQAQSDNTMIGSQQKDFDADLERAEDQFMNNICDDYGREYDNASEVCYEK